MLKTKKHLWIVAAFAVLMFTSVIQPLWAEEDEPIELAPVEKGDDKADETLNTDQVVAQPTAVPMATAAPTVVPTPRPKPKRQASNIVDLIVSEVDGGILLKAVANGPIFGSVAPLHNPERLLLRLNNCTLPGGRITREIGKGAAIRARLAQHGESEVWLVVDLTEAVEYEKQPQLKNAYGLKLKTGGEVAEPPRTSGRATLPKVSLMFFDLNVMFQGQQYERFPCANFIYDKEDKFPLEREFVTTFVFYEGFGAFVGNVRILDPDRKVIDNTAEPIGFNLFNKLTDYSAEKIWNLKFLKKGYYTLVLSLNGEDVLQHNFYVGHNDDRPPR